MCHFAFNQNINEKEEEKALVCVCAPDTCSALQEKGVVEEVSGNVSTLNAVNGALFLAEWTKKLTCALFLSLSIGHSHSTSLSPLIKGLQYHRTNAGIHLQNSEI